jgi:hypothetical protein
MSYSLADDNLRGESWKAWHPNLKEAFRPDRWNNLLWSGSGGGRQGTDLLPALGTARLLGWFGKKRNCPHTYELFK